MKTLKGRVINAGRAEGQAVVLRAPLSFITDYDVDKGCIRGQGGETVADRIVVCPGGKGGTVDPYVAYEAKRRGTAPLAILCQEADPILALSAIIMDIPMIDGFEVSLLDHIHTGNLIKIEGGDILIADTPLRATTGR